ncbi:AraC family transcriptional regulator [Marinobacter apostichopi]|uniref:AraC family transcriptional regulator n=1 Tax=Marinobacter apostichopi TaxID=3035454 RepID=UPI00257335E2|nr:AraC family transcriptional regulator [Marinobacter sp. LA51]
MFGTKSIIPGRIHPTLGLLLGFYFSLPLLPSAALGADIDQAIDVLRAQVSEHSARVFALEQRLLHPADSRLSVFLTLVSPDALGLDSVELFVNDKPVVSYLYSEREQEALEEGGVQQLFIGNLPNGSHSLKAVVTARSGNDRFVRRESSYRFKKRPGSLRLQMTLDAKGPEFEPRVSFREWK